MSSDPKTEAKDHRSWRNSKDLTTISTRSFCLVSSNSAEERLDCDYQGDDIKIGFNSRFLIEMLSGLSCEDIKLSMSMPNRAGLITPIDSTQEGEDITMLVMPVMLNN